jgi:hypothetical protein
MVGIDTLLFSFSWFVRYASAPPGRVPHEAPVPNTVREEAGPRREPAKRVDFFPS